MTWRARGKIEGRQIVLDDPLVAPDGMAVVVLIERAPTEPEVGASPESFVALPFFGMWADRQDLPDSADWVHERRERWRERATGPD